MALLLLCTVRELVKRQSAERLFFTVMLLHVFIAVISEERTLAEGVLTSISEMLSIQFHKKSVKI